MTLRLFPFPLPGRFLLAALLLAALLLLGGCNEEGIGFGDSSSGHVAQAERMTVDRSQLGNRRVAETHEIAVETGHEQLAGRFYRDLNHCVEIGCELLNSANHTHGNSYIHLRIEPEKLPALLEFILSGPGQIRSHEVQVEDKTRETIDAQSRLKNLEALRERLRAMLRERTGTLREALDVEKELAEVETKIDAARAKLALLETITQKATVRVSYRVPYQQIDIRYYELSQSLREAWARLIENVGAVITFTGATLPWVPVLFFFGWLFVALFKLIFLRKRKQDASATAWAAPAAPPAAPGPAANASQTKPKS